MKLYTEEQVKRTLSNFMGEGNVKSYLRTYTPIELPSDDELGKEGLKQWGNVHSVGVVGWIDGAKWMRDKIQGGNL
jgi:hypothetical protein